MIRFTNTAVAVCFPVALITFVVGYCTLDVVRVCAELRRYHGPVALRCRMTSQTIRYAPRRVCIAVARNTGAGTAGGVVSIGEAHSASRLKIIRLVYVIGRVCDS